MAVRGRVAEYDDHKGFGYIETAAGDLLFFHCTAIADGTRTIPAGVEVEYEPVVDPRGQPEAAEVRAWPADGSLIRREPSESGG